MLWTLFQVSVFVPMKSNDSEKTTHEVGMPATAYVADMVIVFKKVDLIRMLKRRSSDNKVLKNMAFEVIKSIQGCWRKSWC